MDEHQELCNTGLALGLNYDTKNMCTSVDQKPRLKNDITANFLKLERSSSNPGVYEPSLTLGLFDDKHGLPKVSCQNMSILGKVSQIHSPTQSTVSSFSDDQILPETKTENDRESDELDKVASLISGGDDEDGSAKKKLRLTKDQSILLELKFKEQSTLNPKQKQALAKQLNLRPRQVEVWFQNRRARTKLKQTQVDCEFLKKCCESLTEENRRLQKELQELRALKRLSSTVYMQVPKSAFTICPCCEKIISTSPSATTDKIHSSIDETKTPKPHFFNPFAHSTAC